MNTTKAHSDRSEINIAKYKIMNQINDLHTVKNDLKDLIDQLADQLIPIMSPYQEKTEESISYVSLEESSLASELRDLSEEFKILRNILTNCMERIEL